MKKISFIILIISVIFSSCKNGNWEFPDNDTSAAYFAYQTPVRTITLGTDYLNDNTLDNEHKCQIMATAQGFYEVKKDIVISFRVDNSLCDNLANVTAMPSDYYSLSDNNTMIIKKGSKMIGGVVVTLTDKFFADPLSLTTKYVIPLQMTDVVNVDGILEGKDYTLYAVKYLNPWDATFLRRGTDNITINGVSETVKRQGKYSPEEDELIKLNSISLTSIEFPVDNHRIENVNLNMTFKLDFTGQNCTFANGAWKDSKLVNEYSDENCRVFDIVISGNGEYRIDGEKQSWGKKDRDALYLTYKAEYKVEYPLGSNPKTVKVETTDVLVLRDRNVKMETFEPVYK